MSRYVRYRLCSIKDSINHAKSISCRDALMIGLTVMSGINHQWCKINVLSGCIIFDTDLAFVLLSAGFTIFHGYPGSNPGSPFCVCNARVVPVLATPSTDKIEYHHQPVISGTVHIPLNSELVRRYRSEVFNKTVTFQKQNRFVKIKLGVYIVHFYYHIVHTRWKLC